MSRKKEVVNTISDLTTAGIVSWVLPIISILPPGLMNVMSIALPPLACGSNLILRLNNEKVLEKDKQKILKFNEEIEIVMKKKKIDDLQNFTNLDFPIEIYSIIEEIIKESINAKGKWLRKFAASVAVTIGSEDVPNLMQGKRLCLNLLRELGEVDIKILFLYEALRKATYEKNINEEEIKLINLELRKELFTDTSIYAQTILTSSNKLKNLGLIEWSCTLKPYDESKGNKEEMIENFLSLNRSDATAHYNELRKYLYTMAG